MEQEDGKAHEEAESKAVEAEEQADKRDSIKYWLKWIPAAKKAAKRHWDDAKAAYKEYEYDAEGDAGRNDPNKPCTTRYSIYWASCKTLEPAYYAKSPELNTRKMFGIDDDLANTMALCIDRLGQYFLANTEFDSVMSATVLDFIHADKCTAQAIYEGEEERVDLIEQLDPMTGQVGIFEPSLDQNGQPIPFQGEPERDGSGPFVMRAIPDTQNIKPAVLPYYEVLHTPEAKMESEIVDKAIYFCLDYSEAIKRFGEEKLAKVNWKTSKTYEVDEAEKDRTDLPGKFLDGWECYSKRTKRTYWVCEDYKDDFLDVKDDPYDLVGFFPCTPFVISSKPSKSLYPTPAYVHVESLIKRLHKMQGRIYTLVDAIRRRAIVDGSCPEVLTAIEGLGDNEFITIQNLQHILEKGGLANLIHWVPVAELVQALPELSNLQAQFENQFNQWFGIPDILRGYSDATQPMGATAIQNQAAHDRFKKDKMRVQALARDLLELMIDMALRLFVPEKLQQVCGFQYMADEHKARFFEAIDTLKNDTMRMVRVDVETDSTSFADEQAKATQTATIASTITQGLQSIAQIGTTSPTFVGPIASTLIAYLETVPGGKQFQDKVKSAVNQMVEAANNPPPAAPPPPDYEGMKLQIAQAKFQGETQQAAINQQIAQQKLNLEAQKIQLDNEARNNEMLLTDQMNQMKLEVDRYKAELSAAAEQQAMATKAQLESLWQDMERQKIVLQEREKIMEEKRLSIDQAIQMQASATPQAVTINVDPTAKKPKKRRVTPIYNQLGQVVSADFEDLTDEVM